MLPIGSVCEEILDIIYSRNDDEVKDRVWRQVNYQYFELCKQHSWELLRAPSAETLDFTGSTSAGLLLPADLMGIDIVWDSTNDQEFFEMDRPDSQSNETGYRYYRYLPSRSHLFEGTDLVLSKNGTSFTSASLSSDGATTSGEFVQFNDEPGLYEISSNTTPFTFTPTYRGENLVQKGFRVRPWQLVKRMVIIDPTEDLLYDRSVKVYYWKAPPPLYREEDMALLPTLEVLKLRVLRALPESKGKFNVSESMLKEALRVALKLNPKFRRPHTARDQHNRRVDVNRNPYGSR